MGFGDCFKGLLHLLHVPPPSPSLFTDPFHETLLPQEIDHLLLLGAIESVPTQLRGKVFLLQVFSDTQVKGRLETHTRSTGTKQICESSEVQDGHSSSYYSISGARKLVFGP